jgi:hypothetical protein
MSRIQNTGQNETELLLDFKLARLGSHFIGCPLVSLRCSSLVYNVDKRKLVSEFFPRIRVRFFSIFSIAEGIRRKMNNKLRAGSGCKKSRICAVTSLNLHSDN